ncbi:MAG: S41 family peptidase [Xanthomonadales bacterium]|nr:S41 family peptidase [Xanthomonadales bacterium]
MNANGVVRGVARLVPGGLLYAAVLAALPAGLMAAEAESPPAVDRPSTSAQLTLDDLRTFTDVFNQVRRNYVEEVDDHTLLESAIRGMLLELDPHSAYLPGDDFRHLEDSSDGRYTGIGVDVHASDGRIVVRAVINGSPADEAGINPGDIITSIDGEPIKGRYLPDAIDSLLGEPDTEVDLVVLTPGGEKRSLTVQRKSLAIPVLSFNLLEDGWGYYKLSMFHKSTGLDLEESLESVRADGIELRGLVIDLRGNPGGVLQGAVELADGFLDEGLIVITRGRNSTMAMEFEARAGQWLPDVPMVVLVDRGTASASEVFAGALQDHGRAVIVGERTFGKGSVQSVLPLRNGGGIKLTTARYYTPSGRSIQAEGIRPDVLYAFAGEPHRLREADLDRHLLQDEGTNGQPRADAPARDAVPLDEALDILENAGILAPSGETGPDAGTESGE